MRNIAEFYKTITNYERVQFNRPTEEGKNVASLIVNHIANIYARSEVTCHDDYKLSVVYTDRILCEDSEGVWDGINYPSVAKKISRRQHSATTISLSETQTGQCLFCFLRLLT
jgi:hypothetical protein